jgi:DNA invertase Pin-like site-specific DNA recombinase
MQAIGYVRVSTEGQALEGVSLEAQRAKIEAWCGLQGMALAAVYVDAGLSGKRADNRPELQRAIAHACKVKGAVVVYSLSRLARSTRDTLQIAETLDRAGADLVSLSEKIDTTSAAGRMVFRMLAVLSEFERDCIAERTSAALQHKKRKGERVGEVPFGFRVASDSVHLEEDPRERAVIEEARELHDKRGLGVRAIARHFNAKGLKNRSGGPWYHSQIAKMVAA